MALGELSNILVSVTQAPCPPITFVCHPGGIFGEVSPSKFWVRIALGRQRGIEKLTVPKLVEPSVNRRVAVIFEPHCPKAVKENGRATLAPPAGSAPKLWDPLGVLTPPPGRSVAIKLAVLAKPELRREKSNVTVSPGST